MQCGCPCWAPVSECVRTLELRYGRAEVVGDGENAIALGGRDCTTQRRFQKIFEEGPPLVVRRAQGGRGAAEFCF